MDSYILYTNVLLIFVLTLIIVSTVITKKENLKTRLSFCFFFLIVIFNSINNLLVLYFGNYQLVFLLYSFSSLGFLFGPMLLQYVYFLLNQKLPKLWVLNYIFSVLLFIIGLYYLFIPENEQKKCLQEMINGENSVLNILNLVTLLHCFAYFFLVRIFLKKFKFNKNDIQLTSKKKWASDFVNYMILCNILIISIYVFLGVYYVKSLVLGDLVFMPLIILSVYSFIVIKSAQQHKETDYILALSLADNQNKLQEQRLNISRDLHDNIGSQLSFVISSVDNIKHELDISNEKLGNKLNSISTFASEAVVELRDTIWALNTENLTLEELEYRILNFVKNASETYENIKFDLKNNCETNYSFTSKQGINIFRVVQEGVNNAIKHAKANQIIIILDSIKTGLSITVKDNGIGFDFKQKSKKSFGLTNLQNRIEELNGTFDLTSNKSGTVIKITFHVII